MKLLSFLLPVFRLEFGGGPSMSPQPVAPNPVDDSAARKTRDDAAAAAQAEALAGGRRSTMVSGIKDDQDQTLGGAPSRRRSARASIGV